MRGKLDEDDHAEGQVNDYPQRQEHRIKDAVAPRLD
jgi:hypothetical protein